jgi:uncharacterized protein YggE
VAADVATVAVSLSTSGPTGPETVTRIQDQHEAVLDALSARGVPRERIHTERFTVSDAAGPFEEAETDAVDADRTITFDCSPSELSRYAAAVVDAGGWIDSVELRVAADRRSVVYDELTKQAVNQAQRRAEAMTAPHEADLGALRTLELTDTDAFSSFVDDTLAAGDIADLSGGPVEGSVAVEAVYDLDP